MTEVYIVHNCLERQQPVTCSTFEAAEKFAETIVKDVITKGSLLGGMCEITRKNMVWSFANGIVAVYIQRVYLGRFHADVLGLDKKIDVLLERTAESCYSEVLDFVKKIDELLNMKIIMANK
jgi:hypothetical protein